jgi:PmbA protein
MKIAPNTSPTDSLPALAERVAAYAQSSGAQHVSVGIGQSRSIELERRDGHLERLQESASSGLSLTLYVDGRFSGHSTSDLRWDALRDFVDRAVPMTRLLSPDPHRTLADPKLYENRSTAPLDLLDPSYDAVTPEQRLAALEVLENSARPEGAAAINSVTSAYSDTRSRSVLLHSNGFLSERASTFFSASVEVSVSEPSGKKPSESHWVGARYRSDLPALEGVGKEAARKALSRIGQTRLPSGSMTLVFENRAARSLVTHWMRGLYGSALQQKRSFLQDKLGKQVGNARFSLREEPFIQRGFGSAHYDGEGISCRERDLVRGGVLGEYLIDVYYANKMGVQPTGGSTTNLTFGTGTRDAAAIIRDTQKGIFVTGLLGGNSDTTRGDFSHGLIGFAIENGQLGAPIGEMNITDNHAALWDRLAEAGNDLFLFSALRTPTLVFEGVSVSGG